MTLGAREGFGIAAQNSAAEGDIRRAQGYQAASNLAGTGAQWSHEERIADRGRGNVIVNNYRNGNSNGQPQQSPFENDISHFACNGWKDFNNDGITSYPDEYIGMKTRFSRNENINFIWRIAASAGNKLTLRIVNSNGNVLSEASTIVPYSDERSYNWAFGDNQFMPGNYSALYEMGGEYWKRLDFSITD